MDKRYLTSFEDQTSALDYTSGDTTLMSPQVSLIGTNVVYSKEIPSESRIKFAKDEETGKLYFVVDGVLPPDVDVVLPPDNEIWFKSNQPMVESNITGAYTNANVIGLKHEDDWYKIVYDDVVTVVRWYNSENSKLLGSKMTEIVLPSSVTTIDYNAFAGCSSLTSFTIPSSVIIIKENAFMGCYFTEDNFINNSNYLLADENGYWGATIYDYKVDGMYIRGNKIVGVESSLTSVVIPDGIESIGRYAFNGCYSLTSITIPSSVIIIDESSFYSCYITKDNFINNSSLDAESNNYWGAIIYDYKVDGMYVKNNTIFKVDKQEIPTEVVIPDGVTRIEGYVFGGSSITSVIIPNSVTSIGDMAFSYCSSLTSIIIPNSVTSIGYDAFYSCYITKDNFINNSSLGAESKNYWGAIVYDYKVDGMYVRDNIIIKSNEQEIPTEVVIPDGITGIGERAFTDCYNITSVTIPNSVTSIGEESFDWCGSLTFIVIPDGVTSIGDRAFRGSSITSVTIPSSVTEIGYEAFSCCLFAKDNFINNSSLDAEENNYWGATIYDYKVDGMYINNNTIIKVNKQEIPTEVVIPDGVTRIEGHVFDNSYYLTSITIPNSIMSIGEMAFAWCESLTSITFKGTTEEWYAITKGFDWDYGCSLRTIHCTDGDIDFTE